MPIDLFGFAISLPLYACFIPIFLHLAAYLSIQKQPGASQTLGEKLAEQAKAFGREYTLVLDQKGEKAGVRFFLKTCLLDISMVAIWLCFLYVEIQFTVAGFCRLWPMLQEIDEGNFSPHALDSWKSVLIWFFGAVSGLSILFMWLNHGKLLPDGKPDALGVLSRQAWLSRAISLIGLGIGTSPLWLKSPWIDTSIFGIFFTVYGLQTFLWSYRIVRRGEACRAQEVCERHHPVVLFLRPRLLAASG